MRTEIDIPGSRAIFPLESTYDWYIVHCKTGKEKTTAEALRINLELVVYLPERKIRKKGNTRFIPLFPGYFFIQVDLQKTSRSYINISPGVLYILECEGIPQAIPSNFVETLRAEITRFNEYSSTLNQSFRSGDTLYITEGPFRGLERCSLVQQPPVNEYKYYLISLAVLQRQKSRQVPLKSIQTLSKSSRCAAIQEAKEEKFVIRSSIERAAFS